MSTPPRASHDDLPVQIRQNLAVQRMQQNLFELDEFSSPVAPQEGAEAAVAPIPTRAAPAGAADDVAIEDVTALLAQVTKQSEDEVKRAGVIETLRACNTVGLLKGQPILQRLCLDMYDETKRNRLMTSSRDSSTAGKPPVVVDAVASGAVRPSQEVSPEVVDVEMVETVDQAADGDFAMVDVPPGEGSAVASGADPPTQGVPAEEHDVALSEPSFVDSTNGSWVVADKAPSITVPSTSGDYAWVEHEDVEQLQAWVQEQLDAAKDPQAVLPLIEDRVVLLQRELPWVSAVLSNLALEWDGLRCRDRGWQFNLELATALLSFFSTSGGQMQAGLAGPVDRGDTHLWDGCHRTQARGCPWPDQWVPPGQPFALDILQALVELAEDPDRDFLHHLKEITFLLGKLQWVAKAYPQVSSHLQPLYAWEQKLERKCKPGDLVRFLATLLISILDAGPCVPLRLQRNTPCYGSSDAGEDDGRVAIGGWFSPLLNPAKAEVLWFSMDVLATPWVQPLLVHTSPKRRIGALELLGTLILFLLAAESLGPSMVDAHLPLTTDNEGNAFAASKRSSKKWPCSALLMELSAQEFHKGVFAQVSHVKRSSHTWADQLTHFDFEGFSPEKRREVSLSWTPSWMILDKLLAFKSDH
ncbi:MKK3 [Symbiodinium sp. CCMP2592]|nr:MKK3 [Symbiodinium sp. CCMP2592]